MVYPSGAVTHDAVSKYQGVVIAEVACTLILFITLRILHFCFWGYTQVNAESTESILYFNCRQKVSRVRLRWKSTI